MPESDNKCSKCLYEYDHPFGLTEINGECSGCFTHREKDSLKWSTRKEILIELLTKIKNKGNKKNYDCVIPVQGDAEDYHTVSLVLNLGLSPLIVSINDYFKNDIGWHNLHNLITYFDLDSVVFNPDIRAYKELIRTSLRKYDHMLWPAIALHTSFPVHIAKEKKIPLVIWGQNQAVEQSGKFSHKDQVEMSEWNRHEHDLFTISLNELLGNGCQISKRLLNYYEYPLIKSLEKSKIKGLYLSNFFRWDPIDQNRKVTRFGFIPQNQSSTFDPYERAGSSVYYKIHDLLKMKRCGYRKVTDHLVREIRHGRITREEAIDLQKFYNKAKIDIKPFFDWLNVSKTGYDWLLKHKFEGLKYLIGKAGCDKPEIPERLYAEIIEGNNPQKEFIIFGKGI